MAPQHHAPHPPSRPFTLPGGPPATPWHAVRFAMRTADFLQECARRYGNPFTLTVTGMRTIFTGNPAYIKQIFGAPPELFGTITGPNIGLALGPSSLLVLSGAAHRRERSLLMPPLHGEPLQAYGRTIQEITRTYADQWRPGQVFNIQHTTQAISLEVIIRVIFGVRQPAQVARFRQAIVAFLTAFTPAMIFVPALRRRLGGYGPWSAFQRAAQLLDQLLLEEIAARRNDPDAHDDLLSLLLAARDEMGQPLSDAHLRDELTTLLLAGHETTASSLAWAFYWTHRNPAILDRLRSELAAVGPVLEAQTLATLPYLKAVCQETLRLNPPVPFAIRLLKESWRLGDYALPAGVAVGVASPVVHADPTLYLDPAQFRPERFLDRHPTPFEYVPFGGGARRCLGAAFALYEMPIVLGSILQGYDLALEAQHPVTPSALGFAIGPRGGVPMRYLKPQRMA